ncbi:MAG: zf-HC2 domain-containing protein [Ruminococcus sp.]|nr:zf-HC2 domain-containing protein [Ruminococcus sp.]
MSEKETQKLCCAVVKDLLPLYYDKVVSEETEALVKAHLDECEDCTSELELYRKDVIDEDESEKVKNGFKSVMKKTHQKTVRIAAIAIVCVLVLTIGGRYLFTQAPIIKASVDDIEVIRACRYEFDDGNDTGYFLLYSFPGEFSYGQQRIENEVNGDVLEITYKKALITYNSTDEEDSYATDILTISNETQFSSITLNGEEIWNVNDENDTPSYVEAYREFETSDNVICWSISDNMMSAEYADGSIICWDFDGNVIAG